jgi:hypothetical protein
MHVRSQTFWDHCWRDKHGDVVIWQMPNLFLIGWAVLTFVSLLFTGRISDIISWAGMILIIIWSLLEIAQGVNYFRRALGAVVLILILLTIIHIT